MGSLEDWGMNSEVNETAIDEIVAACNGDIRGALKALMLVNEHLEAELQQLHASVAHGAAVERGSSALH
jgi:replication-associated recombination protein RarA